ncbi:energy transducer TonB [Brevundimonas bullata]
MIGVGSSPSPALGPGQGGQGAGQGGGTGSGVGRGAGDGRFRLLRGPTMGELRRLHPPAAFRQRRGGQATLSCRIRLDTRLEDCRVIDETPSGMGFGQAALAASIHFRFQPPTRDGAPVDGQEVPVVVLWP